MNLKDLLKRFRSLIAASFKLEKMKPLSQNFQSAFDRWFLDCRVILESTFGKEHTFYEEFQKAFEVGERIRLSMPLLSSVEVPRPFISRTHRNNIKRGRLILETALDNLEHGYIIDIKQLVSAEIFDSILDQAKYLLRKNFAQNAAVLARVVIEDHLRSICAGPGIVVGVKEKASSMNDKLLREGLYDRPRWRKV
ncbi:MAG: hypothetical protein V3U51_00365 [Thermoplasmata archaeon]